MRIRIIIPACLFLLSCAKEGFPPGGPADKSPPEVVRTLPEMGAVRVDPGTQVELWFSEGVKPVTGKDAVFISPNPGGRIRLKWSSKKLRIRFPEPLQINRTYVVTLGTGIRDYRNNPMVRSYSLAFSTGDSLDQGCIFGSVMGTAQTAGIGIWAYMLEDISGAAPESDSLTIGPDSVPIGPDPRRVEPDYIVQCGEEGTFSFSHISAGRYRLFAVRDRLSDRLYKPAEDEIGLTWTDVDLGAFPGLRAGPFLFRMTREDTLAPRIVRIRAPDNRLITVLFNEPVRSPEPARFLVHVLDGDSIPGDPLRLMTVCQDSSERNRFDLLMETAMDSSAYDLVVQGIQDDSGHDIEPSGSRMQFEGCAWPDTAPPVLLKSRPAHRDRRADVSQGLMLFFSEAMDTLGWRRHVMLRDTSDRGIPLSLQQLNPRRLVLLPKQPLENQAAYCLDIDSLWTDMAGNALLDTAIHFITLNRDTLSEVQGSVSDPDSTAGGPVIVSVRQAGAGPRSDIVLSEAGPFRIRDLYPGLYTVWCFRDTDMNGVYSHGSPYPYRPAERFCVFSDTINVRSRWTNTGNDLTLP
ncbi:Ig-like domain-containing protein [bacterium]|nr:Ig-like domain-containing protein [bacterium]